MIVRWRTIVEELVAAPDWFQVLQHKTLVDSALCQGTLTKVGVLLACGVTGPPTPELSMRSSTSLVSVKYLEGSSARWLVGQTIVIKRKPSSSTRVFVELPSSLRGPAGGLVRDPIVSSSDSEALDLWASFRCSISGGTRRRSSFNRLVVIS